VPRPSRSIDRVGEADNNRAGLLNVSRDRGVARRDVILEGGDAVGVCLTLDVDIDLDRHRHAVKLASRCAARLRPVGGAGGGDRLLAQIDDNGVERWVDRVHPLDMGQDYLLRGDQTVPDRGRRLDHRPLPDLCGHLENLLEQRSKLTPPTTDPPAMTQREPPWLRAGNDNLAA
jgi:hypothetical protein